MKPLRRRFCQQKQPKLQLEIWRLCCWNLCDEEEARGPSRVHLQLYDGARREGQLERGLGMEGGEAAGQPASICQHLLGRLWVPVALEELVSGAFSVWVWHEELLGPVEGRLDRKLRYMENLIQLQVAVDLILTCSNKEEEKTNKVELIILQIPGLVELHHLFN